jgi:hypothetical protein
VAGSTAGAVAAGAMAANAVAANLIASAAPAGVIQSSAAAPPAAAPAPAAAPLSTRPVLTPDIPQYFLPIRGTKPAGAALEYRPMLLGFAWVHFLDKKAGVDVDQPTAMLTPFGSGPVPIDWDAGSVVELTDKDVEREPAADARFAALPSEAAKAKSYAEWNKKLADTLFRTRQLDLLRSDQLEALSNADESERDFRIRLQQLAREQRDQQIDKLRARYASKVTTLTERIRKAEQKVQVQEAQAKNAKVSSALSFGAAILGGLLGGRKIASAGNVGRAATAARSATRAMSEGSDVDRAREDLESAQQQLGQLEEQIKLETDAIAAKFDPSNEALSKLTLRPKKTDIRIDAVVLAWTPHWLEASGARPAWA